MKPASPPRCGSAIEASKPDKSISALPFSPNCPAASVNKLSNIAMGFLSPTFVLKMAGLPSALKGL
jgi:hypothetical protein